MLLDKDFTYNLKKSFVFRLGKVTEDNEKIICYVKKNNVKNKSNITINNLGYRDFLDDKDVINSYIFNKPICFVFENVDFKKFIRIYGFGNCDFIFKNCNFNHGMIIKNYNNCSFNNIKIGNCAFASATANNLFIDGLYVQNYYYPRKVEFSALNKIVVNDCNLFRCSKFGDKSLTFGPKNISFFSNNLLSISNSNIFSTEDVFIDSPNIKFDKNSSIEAGNCVDFKSKNFTPVKAKCYKIILNGEKINGECKWKLINKIKNPLTIERLALIETLKNIKSKIELENEKKVKDYKAKINNYSIGKSLIKSKNNKG